ncbi:protein of unknown function DUF610 YibQ [Desulfovibrio sp. X2]|uniref:divergent polysaccharide deacetylase family protein n=1 Tax=Desulfovibrio sp. X2 TaxID=941449 RepID=UPI00035874EC|nr:divergent polysaccharide deacetylase family protein [Desulfovibrio sp. X2]EPR42398.1 protein of unknown function DUF610 YibQ [Desulfovibrio sp. X2]
MTRKSSSKRDRSSKGGGPGFLRRHWHWLTVALAGAGLLATMLVLLKPTGPLSTLLPQRSTTERPVEQPRTADRDQAAGQQASAPKPRQDEAQTPQATPATPEPQAGNESEQRPFEEYGASFEDDLKKIDFSLLTTLRQLDIGPQHYSLIEVTRQHEGDADYLKQSISVQFAHDPSEFAAPLRANLAKWAPAAKIERTARDTLTISLQGTETHILRFTQPDGPAAKPTGTGVLAIVIDDLGENVRMAEALAALPYPVTFAIWPQASHTQATAEIAHKHGLDVIIHQPMEPNNFPRIKPGPGVVLTRMSDAEIARIIEHNITLVPGAIGMNNHMGSKFTSSARGMRVVMSVLKKHNLFFLDSRTSSRSAAQAAAAQYDVRFVGRHVFLDNIPNEDAVMLQLLKAENMALKNGFAVAIGHPHPGTLAALKRWSSEAAPGLRMVAVSSLARDPSKSLASRK